MAEVLRFRMARAPQRTFPDGNDLVPTHTESTPLLESLSALGSGEARRTFARTWLVDGNGVSLPFGGVIGRADEVLAAAQNRLTRQQLTAALGGGDGDDEPPDSEPLTMMRSYGSLGDSLVAGLLAGADPAYLERVHRLILVRGLLDLLRDQPKLLSDADAVQAALERRTVVLPKALFDRPGDRLSRRPGFADLYVVRKDWIRYAASEVAYIQNVLEGESLKRTHTHSTETELILVSDTEESQREERDHQVGERFELSDEAQKEADLAVHVEAGVDAQGQIGPMTIHAHVGGSLDFSQSSSDSHAVTTSREVVDRAAKRVESRVRTTRTARTLTRVSEENVHGIDNPTGSGNVVGVYRWVNKVDRVQVYRYPHRFLVEVQLPEPGAWWRWLLDNRHKSQAPVKPVPFTDDGTPAGAPLGVADVQEGSYSALAARYQVEGMPEPPPPIVTASTILNYEVPASGSGNAIRFQANATLAVPNGYRAVTWSAEVLSWHDGGFKNDSCSVRIAVADTSGYAESKKWASLGARIGEQPLNNLTGVLPVSVMSDAVWGYGITVVAVCHRLDATLRKWQQQVYDLLVEAWRRQQRDYADALSEASAAGGIAGDSSERNRQVVRDELKRQIVGLLVGEGSLGQDAYTLGAEGEPAVDVDVRASVAPLVSFMEQTFEWENLSWAMYPWFWGGRPRWPELAGIDGADPDFAAFLRAGSARVIVPARPGHEQAVHFFLKTGIVWSGIGAPAPNDPEYLSIDAEIRAQQQAPADGTAVGEPWEVRLPTDLVWLQPDADLPENAHPAVP